MAGVTPIQPTHDVAEILNVTESFNNHVAFETPGCAHILAETFRVRDALFRSKKFKNFPVVPTRLNIKHVRHRRNLDSVH